MEVQKPQQYSAVITKKIQLTANVYHFVITLKNPLVLQFIPGQYATFVIDQQIRRQYSICSDPSLTDQFEIVIDTTPMGPGSKYFLEKKEGDEVVCLAPLGNFRLTENPMKKVLIATGTGIAPFRSMILDWMHKKNTTEITLYWGLRHEDDIYWEKELQGLVGEYRGFQYFLCLSKPQGNWQGFTGHVTECVMNYEKNVQNCEFYLCGNTAMISEMEKLLSAQNVKKEQIKTDMFY